MCSNSDVDQAVATAQRLGVTDAGSDVVIADEVAALRRLADIAEAAYVAKLRMFHTRGVSETTEVLTTRQWARHHFGVAPGETARVLKIGKALTELPVVEAALLEGSIRLPHAAAIADAAAQLGMEVIAGCQDALVAAAKVNDPARVRAALRGLGAALDNPADRKRAERQHQERWLDVAATFDGAVSIEGVFDAETGAIVQAAIDAASKPAGVGDRRTASQRRADALVDICAGLTREPRPSTGTGSDEDDVTAVDGTQDADDDTPGADAGGHKDFSGPVGAFGQNLGGTTAGEASEFGLGSVCGCGGRGARPSVLVVCDLDTLTSARGGFGELQNGQVLSGDAVRRLACDASITRIITDGASLPLDVGRAQRTVTTAQLKALRIRDGGCIFPGCDRPIEWCDVHHAIYWTNGGRTDLANLCLLCRKHHTAVHEGGWAIKIAADNVFQFIDPNGEIVTDHSARSTRSVVNTFVNGVTRYRK